MHRRSVDFPHPLLPQSTTQRPFGMFPAICRSIGDFSSAYRNAISKSIIMISFLLVSLSYPFAVRNGRRGNRPKLLVIYFSVLHSCRHPALKKSRIVRRQANISSLLRRSFSNCLKYQNCEPISKRIASSFGALP